MDLPRIAASELAEDISKKIIEYRSAQVLDYLSEYTTFVVNGLNPDTIARVYEHTPERLDNLNAPLQRIWAKFERELDERPFRLYRLDLTKRFKPHKKRFTQLLLAGKQMHHMMSPIGKQLLRLIDPKHRKHKIKAQIQGTYYPEIEGEIRMGDHDDRANVFAFPASSGLEIRVDAVWHSITLNSDEALFMAGRDMKKINEDIVPTYHHVANTGGERYSVLWVFEKNRKQKWP